MLQHSILSISTKRGVFLLILLFGVLRLPYFLADAFVPDEHNHMWNMMNLSGLPEIIALRNHEA